MHLRRIGFRAVALLTATCMISGCISIFSSSNSGLLDTPYRISPNDSSFVLVADNASMSANGRFAESRTSFHWRPLEFRGESVSTFPSDVLAQVATNKAVTRVMVKSEKVWYYSMPKSLIVSAGGLVPAYIYSSSQFGEVSSQVSQGNFSAIGNATSRALIAIPIGLLIWHYSSQILDWVVPDLYHTKVSGDFVDLPNPIIQAYSAQYGPQLPRGKNKVTLDQKGGATLDLSQYQAGGDDVLWGLLLAGGVVAVVIVGGVVGIALAGQ